MLISSSALLEGRSFRLIYFSFWQLLEEKELELGRLGEKYSSQSDELSQIIKVSFSIVNINVVNSEAMKSDWYVKSIPFFLFETGQR